MTPDLLPAATRLCAACGLCCNGVLFHSVELQALDQPREILSLGMKLKRKRRQAFILQPCPAYKDACCSIYDQRPQRCRIFECRQLVLVRSGEITENDAMGKISAVKTRIAGVDELLCLSGSTNRRRTLKRRHQKVLDEPLEESEGSGAAALREALAGAMRELEEVLERDFRVA